LHSTRTFPSLAFNSHLSFSCIQLAPLPLLHSTRTSPSLAFNSHLFLSCIQLAPLPLLHSTRTIPFLPFPLLHHHIVKSSAWRVKDNRGTECISRSLSCSCRVTSSACMRPSAYLLSLSSICSAVATAYLANLIKRTRAHQGEHAIPRYVA